VGEHEVGAFGADAVACHAYFVTHRQHRLDHGDDLALVHTAAVDTITDIALEVEVHPGNCGHRAGGAKHVDAMQTITCVLVRERRDHTADFLHHRLVNVARDIDAA